MLAADGGVKWHGLSVNGQYFFHWLNNFRAGGPLPIGSTFDHGFEMSVSGFVVPKKWELYGRTRTSLANSAILMSTLPASSGTHPTTIVSGRSQKVCESSSLLFSRSLLHTTPFSMAGRRCFGGCLICDFAEHVRRKYIFTSAGTNAQSAKALSYLLGSIGTYTFRMTLTNSKGNVSTKDVTIQYL